MILLSRPYPDKRSLPLFGHCQSSLCRPRSLLRFFVFVTLRARISRCSGRRNSATTQTPQSSSATTTRLVLVEHYAPSIMKAEMSVLSAPLLLARSKLLLTLSLSCSLRVSFSLWMDHFSAIVHHKAKHQKRLVCCCLFARRSERRHVGQAEGWSRIASGIKYRTERCWNGESCPNGARCWYYHNDQEELAAREMLERWDFCKVRVPCSSICHAFLSTGLNSELWRASRTLTLARASSQPKHPPNPVFSSSPL